MTENTVREKAIAAKAGDYVEIQTTLLRADQRARQQRNDSHDLTMRVRGELMSDANLGGLASIKTRTGRVLQGKLAVIAPRHIHNFGDVDPDIFRIKKRINEWLS